MARKRQDMYFENRTNKNGEKFFVAVERYVDPLTEKTKRASVIFQSNTSRGRAQAAREQDEKIEKIIAKRQGQFSGATMNIVISLLTKLSDSLTFSLELNMVRQLLRIVLEKY